jgi:hypothetical protein
MKYLIEQLSARSDGRSDDAGRDLVLVVGAGSGADLAGWRALGARRLLLLEPQTALSAALAARLRPGAGESLMQAALVTDQAPTARLHVLNNPRESGLGQPSGLLEYFPNLRLRHIQEVPAVRLAQILGAVGADHEWLDAAPADHTVGWPQGAVLVVEAPGVAARLVRDNPAMLLRFEWLLLRLGEQALFEEDEDAATLARVLRQVGFDEVEDSPDAIPPFVERLFRRQPLAQPLAQANDRLAALEAQREDLIGQSRESLVLCERLTRENADVAAERDAQARVAADRQAQVEALRKEKADLIAARDTLAKEKTDLTAARDVLAKEKKALQGQLDESRQQLETSRQQQQELSARQQLMQEEFVKAEAQIELIKELLLREPSL